VKAILDTHILLWWFSAIPRLSSRQEEILQGASEDEPLWVSDITLWEIATLSSLGRIRLHLPLREWLEQATAPPLVQRLPITPAVAAEVAALPDSFHRDPADRIIVASARVLGATLLTQDGRIVDSGLIATLS
jgi:PIN domain nuclease of toxin-antitoxin system